MSDDPAPPKPLEVVIVAAAVPLPVVVTTEPRPETFTGRPASIGTEPTIDQLKKERAALRLSNDGRFTVEEKTHDMPLPPIPPLPSHAHRDPIFTVIAMLVVLNTVKLCLLVWALLTVLHVRANLIEAEDERRAISTSLTSVQTQLDRAVAQQQSLIDRVDETLVRLTPPSAR